MKHNIILTKTSKTTKGTVQLTGSKSECNRALIIEALSNGKVKVENISDAADAQIDYVENDGFPPIKLKGSLAQQSNKVSIKGNISSQYITALLLIAARLPLGLELHIEGDLTSRPYVEMTLAMLQTAGIQHNW